MAGTISLSGSVAADPDLITDSRRIDLELAIETPENVVLSYQLAGPAVRLSAWMIDLVIRIALIIAVKNYILDPLAFASQGLSTGLFLVAYFTVDWLYYGLCEGLFRGKTPGKHVTGLRVVHEQGYPITVWGAILRNFVRAGDSLPVYGILPAYGVGLVTMLIAGRFRRLGDLVARTLVIEERRVRIPREPVILEKIQPLPKGELSGFSPSPRTLALIEQFLGRRHVLTHRRGHEMAAVLAGVLAAKLNYSGDRQLVEQYPMAFLARVYATFHRPREEGGDE
ncbi:MAG: RDD family protein [Planctomycetales bacterium]